MTTSELRSRFRSTLPIWPVDGDGHCTCDLGDACTRPGKHADANAPETGPYAVVTGQASGIIVVDIDVKGGIDGFEQAEPYKFPDTFEVDTASGGKHLYYKHPGFHVGNHKLASAIDIKADKVTETGLVYVVGPGSPGFVRVKGSKTQVTPANPYEVAEESSPDAEIVDAPENLLAWLRACGTKKKADPIVPIDETHWNYAKILEKAVGACKEREASKEGEGASKALMSLARLLVREYQLPIETARDLMVKHWLERCTDTEGNAYPWDEKELQRALESSQESGPGEGNADFVGVADLAREKAKPKALRDLAPAVTVQEKKGRKQHRADHRYSYFAGTIAPNPDAVAVSHNELVSALSRGREWEGCWQFNDLSKQVMCVDPPIRLDAETEGLTKEDLSLIRGVLEFGKIKVNEVEIDKAIGVAAKANRYHPVREYLDGLPDGDPTIFEGLAKTLFGDEGRFADDFFRKTLVAAVRRILTPGCQVDTVLILQGGRQGEGKTQSVSALFGDDWTRSGLPGDLGNRDAQHALRGFWAIELGELTMLLRNDHSVIKDFLSKRIDDYREYNSGKPLKNKRQCVFIGTTNDDDFLRDPTGARRFWPIAIPEHHTIPVAWIREHRDAIWSAAHTLAKDETFRHWYNAAEEADLSEARERFVERDGWHDDIESYCRGKPTVKGKEIFTKTLCGDIKNYGRKEQNRMGAVLKRLGCTRIKKESAWRVPETLATQPEEKPEAEVIRPRANGTHARN